MTVRSTGSRVAIPAFPVPRDRYDPEQEAEFRRDLEHNLADITERSGPRRRGDLGLYDPVLDYGVIADGVADDGAALQATIDDAGTDGGGVVIIPAAAHIAHSTQINLRANVLLVGRGYGSRLRYTGTALGSQQGQIHAQQVNRVGLINLRIDGDGNQTLAAFHGCTHSLVEGCWFEQPLLSVNVAAIGIYDDDTAVAGTSGPYLIRGNFIRPNAIGVLIQGRTSGPHTIQDVVISDNIIDGSVNDNIDGVLKVDLEIERVTVARNLIDGGSLVNDGINVQENLRRVSVVDNVIRNCRRNAIIAEDGQTGGVVQELLISDNVIEGISPTAPQRGVSLNVSNGGSMRNVVINNNLIRNCGGEGIAENTGGITQLSIQNNVCDECSGAHAILARGTDVLVQGNKCTHSSSGGVGDPRSFRIAAGGSAWVQNNQLLATDNAGAVTINGTATMRNNQGFVSENNGTATITAAATSIDVTHGIGRTPSIQDIQVTPTNNMGNATKFWISGVTSTQFTINIDVAPGGGNTATFVWAVFVDR